MSWRIENANPFTLLAELPDSWAQTCFLGPPRDLPAPCLLAVLEHVHRVLRDDGTLWLSFPGRGNCPKELLRVQQQAGWLRPERRECRQRSVIGRGGALTLFSKQQEFHFDAHPSSLSNTFPRHNESCRTRPRARRFAAHRQERRAWCVPAAGGDPSSISVIERCLRSSTSPRACGVCGTPWQRIPSAEDEGGRWRSGCSHLNDRGRCLVLDPFSTGAEIGVLTVRAGRSYLGVDPNPDTAIRSRRRLETLEREARR
jgi:hypothetical protein